MEDEVDYTMFYYGKHRPDRDPPRPAEERSGGKREKPKKKKGRFLFVFSTLVLCFSLLFFCADFFGNGFLTDAVKKAFSGENYEYYFVVEKVSGRFTAYATALEVRQNGGGGYIYGEENYVVAYSVFTDKTTALGVQTKNKVTEIHTVKYRTKEDLAAMTDNLVRDLEKGISDWEKGKVTETDLATVIRVHSELFEQEKVKYENEKRSLVDLICDGLSSFSLSATEKITQLGQLRYFLCCTVYSSYSVFG